MTANQAVVDKDEYPYTLTTDWGYGARSQRITSLIEQKIKDGGKISTDDMRQMQLDNSSEMAKLLVPQPLKIDIADKDVRDAQKLLEGWDYTQDADSAAAGVLQRGLAQHPQRLRQELPKELRVEGQCLWVDPAPTPPARRTRPTRSASAASATPTRRSRTAATAGSRWSAR
ncbi:Penicillin acylase family protein OS=Streptomyces tendae OX=1932 GN=GUR47_27385 PE=3 SV=1 [Streptomyces tendae]